ncbi:hypothetical protein ABXS69_04545 [Actinomyces timonensis]|uniref:Uncharacterized protein n=1 Tax=Actinomyces timonensis TaxID=1288391 RepID=A0AAU8N3P7_9ACTO
MTSQPMTLALDHLEDLIASSFEIQKLQEVELTDRVYMCSTSSTSSTSTASTAHGG